MRASAATGRESAYGGTLHTHNIPLSVLNLPEYARDVHRIRFALDRLAATDSTSGLGSVVTDLRSLQYVRISTGTSIRTSTPDFADQLTNTNPTTVRRVSYEIDALDVALRTRVTGQANLLSLAALDSVLSDPRFHPSQNIFVRFGAWLWQPIQWVLDRLQAMLQSVQPGGEVPGIIVLLIAALLLLAVTALTVVLARSALARMTPAYEPATGADEPESSVAALARSAEYETTGDYRTALRYLVLATMFELRDRGALDLRPSLTNREHLHRLQAGFREGPAGEAFGELVELFDHSWYGHRPVDRKLYDHARVLSRQASRVQRERSA